MRKASEAYLNMFLKHRLKAKIQKFVCFFNGHDNLLVYSDDNQYMQCREYRCQRCLKETSFQYDK